MTDPSWSLSFNAYQAMVNVIGIDRIVFTADHPFANMAGRPEVPGADADPAGGQGKGRARKRRAAARARRIRSCRTRGWHVWDLRYRCIPSVQRQVSRAESFRNLLARHRLGLDSACFPKGSCMSNRNTVVRSMHDLGAAAWFGGALMGAIGVNGAAAAVREPRDRARVASVGWAKWSPVNAAAIAAHLVGGGAILYANRRRAKHQSGVTANTVTKIIATGAALGATVYSGALGAKTAQGDGHAAHGATEPSSDTPDDVASAQRQLQVSAVGASGADRNRRRTRRATRRATTAPGDSDRVGQQPCTPDTQQGTFPVCRLIVDTAAEPHRMGFCCM